MQAGFEPACGTLWWLCSIWLLAQKLGSPEDGYGQAYLKVLVVRLTSGVGWGYECLTRYWG